MTELKENQPSALVGWFGRLLRGPVHYRWTFRSMWGKTMLLSLTLFAVFFLFLAAIQFSIPDLPGNDGYYHIKLAYLMRTEGLIPEFTWLPLTILNQREFYDHHFLYHVALIPFTFGDLILGAKWATVFFGSLTFLSVWWLFRSQRVPYDWLWALGLLAVSEAFIYRMSIPRAQSLSLAALAVGVNLLLGRRHKWLLPLGFIYVWLYNAFPLLLVVSGFYVLVILVMERRLDLRPLLFSGTGVALGLIANPYFPDNIVFIIRHILPKLFDPTSLQVGSEWYPYTTAQLIENAPFGLVAFISGVIALGFSNQRMSTRTAFSLILAIFFAILLFQARRYVEYFPAFGLIFATFAWADYLNTESDNDTPTSSPQDRDASWLKRGLPKLRNSLPALVLTAFLIPGIWLTYRDAGDSVASSKPFDLYRGAATWLQDNSPPGSRVFQTDWDDFPRLFFYNTHNTYLVGLDPTYMQMYNADLYEEWVDITRGQVEKPARLIRERFASEFVLTDLKHNNFLEIAQGDPGLVEVYRDEQAVVFELR